MDVLKLRKKVKKKCNALSAIIATGHELNYCQFFSPIVNGCKWLCIKLQLISSNICKMRTRFAGSEIKSFNVLIRKTKIK